MAWEKRRNVYTRSNLYDRASDPVGGAAVVFGDQDLHLFHCTINGRPTGVPFPDTAAEMGGDRGQPVAVRLRYDHAEGAWFIYTFMFSGDDNPRSEWVERIG